MRARQAYKSFKNQGYLLAIIISGKQEFKKTIKKNTSSRKQKLAACQIQDSMMRSSEIHRAYLHTVPVLGKRFEKGPLLDPEVIALYTRL